MTPPAPPADPVPPAPPAYSVSPAESAPTEVRIGDAERDRAVAALGDHFAAGRLDPEELDERVGRAIAARVRSDLVPLFADLPGPAPDLPSPASRTPAGLGGGGWPTAPGIQRPPLVLPVLLLLAVVAAVAAGAPWPLWLVLWGTIAVLAGRRRRRRAFGGPDSGAVSSQGQGYLRAGRSLSSPQASWEPHTGGCRWGGRV